MNTHDGRPASNKPAPSGPSSRVGNAARPNAVPFTKWIRSLPALYGAIGLAVSASSTLLAPDSVLPEPLADPFARYILSALSIVAFGVTWILRDVFSRRRRTLTAFAVMATLSLLALYLSFVRPIESGSTTTYYITGGAIRDSYCGPDYESAITQCGDDWAGLTRIWGREEYIGILTAYMIAYAATVSSIVVLIGIASLSNDPQPIRKPSTGSSSQQRRRKQS